MLLLASLYFFTGLTILKTQELHWTPDSPVNLWEESGQFEGDILLDDEIGPRNALRSGLWPNGIVPYTIKEDQFSKEEVNIILNVMKELEDIIPSQEHNDKECQIKFVPRKQNQREFVEIYKGEPRTCVSHVGYKGKKQTISYGEGCIKPDKGTVRHELLHTLGLGHQHSAHNRDDYVNIHWKNIKPDAGSYFKSVDSEKYTDFKLGYDFNSIMHYSPYAFAKRRDGRPVGPTIIPKDPRNKINRTNKISDDDKMKLKLMYCKKYTREENT